MKAAVEDGVPAVAFGRSAGPPSSAVVVGASRSKAGKVATKPAISAARLSGFVQTRLARELSAARRMRPL